MAAVENDKAALKEISDFAYEAFKDSDPSMEAFVVPMLYNIAYKYAVNADGIKKIVALAKLDPKDAYAKAFASVILSPSLFNAISIKAAKNKQTGGVKAIREAAERSWNRYAEKLQLKSEELAVQLEEFKRTRMKEKDWFMKSNIDDSIKKMVEQKKAIDKTLSEIGSREKFVDAMIEKVITKSNVSAIRAQADVAAVRALV